MPEREIVPLASRAWIRAKREAFTPPLTQRQVAHALHVSLELWKKIERGRRHLPLDLHDAYLDYLDAETAAREQRARRTFPHAA